MAKVIGWINPNAHATEMSMLEMNPDSQREVYAAAVAELDIYHEMGLLGTLISIRFLVEIKDGRVVDFPFTVCELPDLGSSLPG